MINQAFLIFFACFMLLSVCSNYFGYRLNYSFMHI